MQLFWVVTTCNVVVAYKPSGEPLKRWYPTTKLHGVTTQKNSTWNIIAVRISNLDSETSMVKLQLTGSLQSEDGGIMDLWNVGILPKTTRHHNP
jgi:hypothetical protein